MHGLVNRAVQNFTRDTYGDDIWNAVAKDADLGLVSFESMLHYPDRMTEDMIASLAKLLNKTKPEIFEDIGTYLVSHASSSNLRRLLRFGGTDYVDFLHSLDDLSDRAKLAVSDLELPQLELVDVSDGQYSLICKSDVDGFTTVLIGVLRAMADDYGALVFLDTRTNADATTTISVALLDDQFAKGNSFALASKSA